MQLTSWEWDELRQHLEERPDIWNVAPDGQRYYRTSDDVLQWVLLVKEPAGQGPLRMYSVDAVPIAQPDPPLQALVSGYTSYDTRLQIVDLLINELAVDPRKAQLAAIAILYISYTGDATPRLQIEELPVQQVLPGFEDTTELVGLWPLQGSGWLRLQFRNEQLHATMSIPHAADYGSGFGPQLRGIVHPVAGTPRLAAGMLAGWPTTPAAIDTAAPAEQLPLEL